MTSDRASGRLPSSDSRAGSSMALTRFYFVVHLQRESFKVYPRHQYSWLGSKRADSIGGIQPLAVEVISYSLLWLSQALH